MSVHSQKLPIIHPSVDDLLLLGTKSASLQHLSLLARLLDARRGRIRFCADCRMTPVQFVVRSDGAAHDLAQSVEHS